MKKYKLLKDLPLYKAGTVCTLSYCMLEFSENSDGGRVVMTEQEITALKRHGRFDEWFEEFEENGVWKPEEGDDYWNISGDGADEQVLHDSTLIFKAEE